MTSERMQPYLTPGSKGEHSLKKNNSFIVTLDFFKVFYVFYFKVVTTVTWWVRSQPVGGGGANVTP